MTLLALASLGAALIFLHTPPGRALVERFLEGSVAPALGAELRFGSLSYRLWAGALDATAVSLRWEDARLDVREVHLRWSPGGGLRVRLLRPNLVVRGSSRPPPSGPATGIAARPWTALERLAEAEITEGRLELQDAHGVSYLVLDPLGLTSRERGSVIHLGARNGFAPAPPRTRLPLAGDATLHLEGGSLVVDALHLESRGSSIDIRGALRRVQPLEGTAAGRIDADPTLLALVSPDSAIEGRVRAQVDLTLRGTLSGRVRASSPALTVRGVGPWDASLSASFDGRGLEVDSAEARGYGGQLSATGPLALDERSTTDLALRAENLDAAALARSAGAVLPFRSRLDARLRWTTKGLDVDRGRGTAQVTLRPLAAPAAPAGATAAGLPVSGSTKVALVGRRLELRALRLETPGAAVSGDLALTPRGNLEGRYSAELSLDSLPTLAVELGTPSTLPALVGHLDVEGEIAGPARDPLLTARLRGDGVSTEEARRLGTVSFEGDGRYGAGRLTLQQLIVRSSGGGEAVLAGSVPVREEGGDWDLRGEVRSLEIAPLLAGFRVRGSGPLDGRVCVQGPRAQPAVDADLVARLRLAGGAEPIGISLSGASAGTRISIRSFEAALAGGHVRGEGSFDAKSGAISANATADGVRLARLPWLPPSLRGFDGALVAGLTLRGTKDAPRGELRAEVGQASWGERTLPGFELTAHADGRRLDLAGASVEAGPPRTESVFLRGGGPLREDWPLRLQVDTAALPFREVLEAIPAAGEWGATLAASGTVTVDVALRRPGSLHYAGEGLVASGRLQDLEWHTGPFQIEGGSEEAAIHGLRLTTTSSSPASPPAGARGPASERGSADARPGAIVAHARAVEPADEAAGTAPAARGTLVIDGRVAIAPDRAFDLAIEGGLDLGMFRQVAGSRVAGEARVKLQVGGTGALPDLRGEVSIENGRGRLGPVWVSGVQLMAHLEGARARVERLEASLLGGRLTASGMLPLRELPPGSPAHLRFEAGDLDLSRLALSRSEAGADAPSLFVSVTGELEASAPDLDAVAGRGRFTRFEEDSPEGRIALAAPAEWKLERGRFEIAPLRLQGPLGTLEARAQGRIAGGPVAGSASLVGPLDLRTISPFLADATLAGPARLDLRASWDPKGLRLDGGLTVEDGRVTLDAFAFTISQIKGELGLRGDRATVDATAASGDGRLILKGGMSFGPHVLGPTELRLDAERVPISYPDGFRARASGMLRLSGEPGAYGIKGDIALTQAYYTADFDQKGRSLDRLERQLAALQGETSIGESLPLSVRVRFVDPLRIRNARATLDVVGEFTAQGTLAQPAAGGQVSLLEGGIIRIRRGDVRVQQARVELNGYPAGNPELDLSGISQIAGIEMDVRARGTFENLQLDITSPNRPDLSETDLVSLLLTGRTVHTAAAQSTTIVAEELAAALGGVVQKNVGELLLVDVGPERSLLSDDLDPTQRFSLGARLRQNLVVLYSTRLDGTDRRWIVEWNPGGGRLRFRAFDDQQQGLSFEASHRLSFDVFRRRRAQAPEPREVAKLVALRFEGEIPLPRKLLAKAAGLKIGRAESVLRREQAAEKVRERLVSEGWLSADVETESAPAAKDPRSLELTLRIRAGPRIRVTWTGDDPGKEVRKRALAAWPAHASAEAAAVVVGRTATVLLRAERFFLAEVEPETRQGEGETELLLHVARGPRGTGVVLDFEGNTVLADEALRAVLPKPGSREFFLELAGRGNRLGTALRIAYAQVGYLHVRVLRPRQGFDPETGAACTSWFPIRERSASLVSALVLPQELRDAGKEAPALSLREGKPFDLDAYIADRDVIAAWYRASGWMEARVRGVLEPSGDELRVSFVVAAGVRLRAGKVRIESRGRTRPTLVRHAVAVEPGAVIRPRELSESRARLAELNVFRSVDVRPVRLGEIEQVRKGTAAGETGGQGPPALPAPPAGTARGEASAAATGESHEQVSDVVVSYVERRDVTLEYGLRYSRSGAVGVGGAPSTPDNGRLQLAGALELANPFGWGWRLRPYALLTTERHTLGTALESATLFGWRVRTQLLVFDDADNRASTTSLASRVRGVSLQQTRSLLEETATERQHDRLRLQWGFADKRIEYLDPTGAPTSLAGRRSYFGLSLVGDERDSLTDPHRGLFWTASSELSRRAFGSDVDYLRLYGQIFAYLPLPVGMVWAQGYRAGIAPGDDPILLLDNRFQAGGPTTVRGYDQNQLGPQTAEGIGLGGQGVVIVNQELRFPIWRFVAGGIFWDAGNVWVRAGDVSLGDLRQSVGAGLRFMLPFGPVRIEYAWNVGTLRGASRGRFVFGLGHAF